MILSSVDELLSRVLRLEAVDATLNDLRRGVAEVRLGGLTDAAKAIVLSQLLAVFRRPAILIVESDSRAETLIEPLRYFLRASSSSSSQVLELPAIEPGSRVPPHPEILESRALALWHFVNGEAAMLVVPMAAALSKYRHPAAYAGLARNLERDMDLALDDLIEHLESTGYARGEMVEMPGQYAQRGGIIDIFPPEAARPFRIELLGDAIESLREFDPDTQRSVRPVERAVIPPLLENPRTARDGNHHDGVSTDSEFGTLFDLADRPLVILDEPSALAAATENIREKLRDVTSAVSDSGIERGRRCRPGTNFGQFFGRPCLAISTQEATAVECRAACFGGL